MVDVAIVGAGIHPFGRTPGKSGLQQGAFATRAALKDAGVEWNNMQFAYGGSMSSGSADSLVNELGLKATLEALRKFDTDGRPIELKGQSLSSKGSQKKNSKPPTVKEK